MNATDILAQFSSAEPLMGDIKKMAKTIKKDHELATELWESGHYYARLLSVLILDKKHLNSTTIESMIGDLEKHSIEQSNQISDWLLANQLVKSKTTLTQILTWREHQSAILRRLYWYQQARLRWMGKVQPDSAELLDYIDADIQKEKPEVQWMMNFCAGQIGVHEPDLRPRCIQIGETTGLYRDEKVAKNCTPSYLPEFIRIEVEKRS